MSRQPAWTQYHGASFGTPWRTWRRSLSILISTPYLDEARGAIGSRSFTKRDPENRHSGRITRSLGAKRLEVRVDNLSEAERVLSEVSGPLKDIMDVERFGDRLDVLAHDQTKRAKSLKNSVAKPACTLATFASMDRLSRTCSLPACEL